MPRTLVSWSDRGVAGPKPRHHGARATRDRGPLLRLVEQPESQRLYDKALVLTSEAGELPARALVEELEARIPEVELVTVALTDPSDYAELYATLQPTLGRLSQMPSIDVVLSAGTPQMQTLWLIAVKAGLFAARMLQVIPADFVPSVHPNVIRVVELDIEGFPEIRALRDELVRLRAHSRILGGNLVGDSEPMRALGNRLGRVAPTDLPVLIHGETGTGKELVARCVHDSSHRASGPLITENCGALTESVLASELFGHERGAFTGAAYAKRGLFELAHGGTLFLDEIGELSPRVQVNLLRVLQDGSLRRLGSEKLITVDVRIVAATHRDLLAMVREGTFREDLYYRLQGATLTVPPLRQRLEDLEPLVAHFLSEVNSELKVTREAWAVVRGYAWPGNVRELRAEVLRWHVFCDRWVRAEDLDPKLSASPAPPTHATAVTELAPLADTVTQAERTAISHALEHCQGNLSQTARALHIDRNTLKRKIRTLGIVHQRLPRGRPPESPV
ncbi:MAG: sigma-54 interaction domain-containing protein [Nannocystales bacterium]